MPDIMKTMCQLYLFMYLFRFAASCRFFFAWQQTHWLNYYFCLSDASCMLKNQRCSNGKKQKKQLSVIFLSHRFFLVGSCLCVSGASPPQTSWAFASCTPKSAAPEVVLTHINTPEQRWWVWGCASFILLTYTQHFYLLWVYLCQPSFIQENLLNFHPV